MSRPSNVTAEMAAALAGEKSGTGHTHSAEEIAGLDRILDASLVASLLDNDKAEIIFSWIVDFEKGEWTLSADNYKADFPWDSDDAQLSVTASRMPPWLQIEGDTVRVLKRGTYQVTGRREIEELTTVQSPPYKNSYQYGTPCFNLTEFGRAKTTYADVDPVCLTWEYAPKDTTTEIEASGETFAYKMLSSVTATGYAIAKYSASASYDEWPWGNKTTGSVRITETVTVQRFY